MNKFSEAVSQITPLLAEMQFGIGKKPTLSQEALQQFKNFVSQASSKEKSAVTTTATWESLTDEISRQDKNTKRLLGKGNRKADLVFVGEIPNTGPGGTAPADTPHFSGEPGKLFTKILQAMGLKTDDVYLIDFPPTSKSGVADQAPWIETQIQLIRPRGIVALGHAAAKLLLRSDPQVEKKPLSELRGGLRQIETAQLLITYHPAYLVRNPAISAKRKVWEDLLGLMEKLDMPISEKQRRFFQSA